MAPLIKGPTISDAPTVNVLLIKKGAKENEIIMIGPLKLEVLEDGSNTDNRIGATHIYIPPHTPGPPQHWHQVGPIFALPFHSPLSTILHPSSRDR